MKKITLVKRDEYVAGVSLTVRSNGQVTLIVEGGGWREETAIARRRVLELDTWIRGQVLGLST